MDEVTEWMNLGLALGIKYPVLKTIKANAPQDLKLCLNEVIDKWLNECYPSSWKSLSDALRSTIVGRNDVASKIEKKYVHKINS